MTKRTGARTGGQILVDQLRIQGCDRIFTVPGESFLAVLDALHDTPEIDTRCLPAGGRRRLHGGRRREDDGTSRDRLRHARPRRDQRQRRRPRRFPGFDPDDPLHRRCRARRPRPRGLPGNRLPGLLRPDLPSGRRGSRMRARIPEYIYRAYRVATAGRPGPVVLALPEDMLTDEVEAVDRPMRSPGRGGARSRRDPGHVRASRRKPPRLLQSSAAPTGAHARPTTSPTSPSATVFPSPPPSAARTRSTTSAASMPASSATGPTPSCSSASARRT